MDPASTPPSFIGRTVAHYRILRQIGAGGMGVVYEAEDQKLGRHVALKFIPQALAHDPDMMSRFRREARAASALNHPNICTIYSIESSDSVDFIAMELLTGRSLRELIGHQPLPLDELLRLGIEMSDALVAAHAAGITHRDIKPANILVTADGRAKVLDFGVAKMDAKPTAPDAPTLTHGTSHALTGNGAAIGTLGYMAPEQARGLKIDSRADLFSLGAVLYEMATGRSPFQGETAAVIYDALLNRDPLPPSQLNPSLPLELEHVIGKALEKDRNLRYQTAAELGTDLKRLQRGSVPSGLPTSVNTKRGRSFAWGIFALLLFAIYVGRLYWKSSHAPPPLLRAEFEQLTDFTDAATYPALSADGKMLAFLRGTGAIGSSASRDAQVFVKQLPNGEPMALTHDDSMKALPIFSPEGTRLVYTAIDKGFVWDTWQVPIFGGTPVRTMPNMTGLSWIGPDNLLFSEVDHASHMVLATAREDRSSERLIYSPATEAGMVHRSALSPDHKWVVAVEMDGRGWLPCRLIPFDGANPGRAVGPDDAQCTFAAWSPDGHWMYFTARTNGGFHIWRQRFPQGSPEQVTFGSSQEEGLAVAPDGSLITASINEQSSVWMHDANGDRPVTREGYSFLPTLSRNGKQIYYLVRSGSTRQYVEGELWVTDLMTGQSEKVLRQTTISHYAISPDGKEVLYTRAEAGSGSGIWVADLEHRYPPRQVTHDGEFRAFFLPDRRIIYQSTGDNYLVFTINEDGSGRRQVSPDPIIHLINVSPDGKWAIVASPGKRGEQVNLIQAMSVQTGSTTMICEFCVGGYGPSRSQVPPISWQPDGRAMYLALQFFGLRSATAVIPYSTAGGPPSFHEGMTEQELKADFHATIIPQTYVFPAADNSTYAFVKRTLQSNIYRVRLREQ